MKGKGSILQEEVDRNKEIISQAEAQKYKDFYDRARSKHRNTLLRMKARVQATKELRANHREEYIQLSDEAYRQLSKEVAQEK